jgi:hypothetical protein
MTHRGHANGMSRSRLVMDRDLRRQSSVMMGTSDVSAPLACCGAGLTCTPFTMTYVRHDVEMREDPDGGTVAAGIGQRSSALPQSAAYS